MIVFSLYKIQKNDGEKEFHATHVEADALGQGAFGAIKARCPQNNNSNQELAVRTLKKGARRFETMLFTRH